MLIASLPSSPIPCNIRSFSPSLSSGASSSLSRMGRRFGAWRTSCEHPHYIREQQHSPDQNYLLLCSIGWLGYRKRHEHESCRYGYRLLPFSNLFQCVHISGSMDWCFWRIYTLLVLFLSRLCAPSVAARLWFLLWALILASGHSFLSVVACILKHVWWPAYSFVSSSKATIGI